jgi:hypothetical protein
VKVNQSSINALMFILTHLIHSKHLQKEPVVRLLHFFIIYFIRWIIMLVSITTFRIKLRHRYLGHFSIKVPLINLICFIHSFNLNFISFIILWYLLHLFIIMRLNGLVIMSLQYLLIRLTIFIGFSLTVSLPDLFPFH